MELGLGVGCRVCKTKNQMAQAVWCWEPSGVAGYREPEARPLYDW